jgi:hypothetical protein
MKGRVGCRLHDGAGGDASVAQVLRFVRLEPSAMNVALSIVKCLSISLYAFPVSKLADIR